MNSWFQFWMNVYFGTSLGGSIFGMLVGVFFYFAEPSAGSLVLIPISMIVGALWAGVVGLFVITTFALMMWIIFCLRRPLILAGAAGALTGLVSMPFLFPVTGLIGAGGAIMAARVFLASQESWELRCAEEARLANDAEPLRFSIFDLMLRTTGAAVLIAFWTFAIKSMYHYQNW